MVIYWDLCRYIYHLSGGDWNMTGLFSHILGMSSSQLRNSYFSEGLKPPTSCCCFGLGCGPKTKMMGLGQKTIHGPWGFFNDLFMVIELYNSQEWWSNHELMVIQWWREMSWVAMSWDILSFAVIKHGRWEMFIYFQAGFSSKPCLMTGC